jgi:hypothetical protein
MAKRNKPGERWRELGRQARLLQAKQRGEKIVPDKILRRLAALRIPEANQFVYQACLEKLMRDFAPSHEPRGKHLAAGGPAASFLSVK